MIAVPTAVIAAMPHSRLMRSPSARLSAAGEPVHWPKGSGRSIGPPATILHMYLCISIISEHLRCLPVLTWPFRSRAFRGVPIAIKARTGGGAHFSFHGTHRQRMARHRVSLIHGASWPKITPHTCGPPYLSYIFLYRAAVSLRFPRPPEAGGKVCSVLLIQDHDCVEVGLSPLGRASWHADQTNAPAQFNPKLICIFGGDQAGPKATIWFRQAGLGSFAVSSADVLSPSGGKFHFGQSFKN